MRKLASIQRIKGLDPIAGADNIVKATVLGWQLVVKKNEFCIGDLCVCVEIDSVLPDKPVFEFLRKVNFRIKTVRLRGQISQGICFPLEILPAGIAIEEGQDVTEIMGVTKYEPPIPASLSGLMKGSFPSFIPKTDETRVQIMQESLTKHKGADCYITEKLDGTSVTYYIRDGIFGVCSRNLELQYDTGNTYCRMAEDLKVEEKLRNLGRNVAIQGELMGEGIQGNKLGLKNKQVFFFSLFWIDEYRFAGYDEWKQVFEDVLQLEHVPVVMESYELSDNIETLLAMAERNSVLNKNIKAEGMVIRSRCADTFLSFKAISNSFLMKYDD